MTHYPNGCDGKPTIVCVLDPKTYGNGASKERQRFSVDASAVAEPGGLKAGDTIQLLDKVWLVEEVVR